MPVHVIVINATGFDPDFLPARFVSEARRQRLFATANKDVARLSAAAELALLVALNRHTPNFCPPAAYRYLDSGKPELADLHKHISLSHSGPFAACAFSDAPIGADVETRLSVKPSLSRRVLSDCEIASGELSGEQLSAIWCVKESVLKLTGEGLSGDMRTLTVGPAFAARANGERAYYRLLSAPFYRLSAAARDPFDWRVAEIGWTDALAELGIVVSA